MVLDRLFDKGHKPSRRTQPPLPPVVDLADEEARGDAHVYPEGLPEAAPLVGAGDIPEDHELVEDAKASAAVVESGGELEIEDLEFDAEEPEGEDIEPPPAAVEPEAEAATDATSAAASRASESASAMRSRIESEIGELIAHAEQQLRDQEVAPLELELEEASRDLEERGRALRKLYEQEKRVSAELAEAEARIAELAGLEDESAELRARLEQIRDLAK